MRPIFYLEIHAVLFIILQILCVCDFTLRLSFVTLCCLCSFKTQDVPSSGPYLVEVMGVKSGKDQFWETLLYNDTSKEVKPISKLKVEQIVVRTKPKKAEAALLWRQK